MDTGDTTAEHLQMAAVKESNRTLAADEIDWCVSQIDRLCKWYVVNICLVILHCCHPVVESKIGHVVEPWSLTLVETLS
jgi:hypothetical protein